MDIRGIASPNWRSGAARSARTMRPERRTSRGVGSRTRRSPRGRGPSGVGSGASVAGVAKPCSSRNSDAGGGMVRREAELESDSEALSRSTGLRRRWSSLVSNTQAPTPAAAPMTIDRGSINGYPQPLRVFHVVCQLQGRGKYRRRPHQRRRSVSHRLGPNLPYASLASSLRETGRGLPADSAWRIVQPLPPSVRGVLKATTFVCRRSPAQVDPREDLDLPSTRNRLFQVWLGALKQPAASPALGEPTMLCPI